MPRWNSQKVKKWNPLLLGKVDIPLFSVLKKFTVNFFKIHWFNAFNFLLTFDSSVAIKKRSKVPGVMITQFVEEIPAGKCHPDFSRKPIALTIQEGMVQQLKASLMLKNEWLCFRSTQLTLLNSHTGKFAFFKAIITGDPTPNVTWSRNNGDTSDPGRYIPSYDPVSGEHQLQVPFCPQLVK